MSVSDAQKRAIANYRKKSVKQFQVTFYPDDTDLYAWFKGKQGKNKLIKELLRAEMERENNA